MFYSSEGTEVCYGKKTFSNSCVVEIYVMKNRSTKLNEWLDVCYSQQIYE